MGRAPRTKETLPDFLKWRRVTRPPLVFRRLTGSQRTPGFWGVTIYLDISPIFLPIFPIYLRYFSDISDISAIYLPKNHKKCFPRACLPHVDISTEISPRFRYFADISAIFADFLRFFHQTTLYIKYRFGGSRYTKYRRNIGRYFRHFNPWLW